MILPAKKEGQWEDLDSATGQFPLRAPKYSKSWMGGFALRADSQEFPWKLHQVSLRASQLATAVK